MGLLRFEALIEGTRSVSVQIVDNQDDDDVAVGIVFVRQRAQLFGKIVFGASIGDADSASAAQGFDGQE